MRLRGGIAVTGTLAAALAATGAPAATTSAPGPSSSVLVVTGRGFGHGVGMSQWGAYGYALHGWSYRQILAHYYPGTQLGRAGDARVRVLLVQGAGVVTVGCKSPMHLVDATGMGHALPAGQYGVGPHLVFPVGRSPSPGAHRHTAHDAVRAVGRSLRQPVVVECPTAPLELDGRGYHGTLVLRSSSGRVSVVNALPLDAYLRGVVGDEMPSHWSPAALEAQAVAARSYALATLHPEGPFDLYPDERSQAYGGIAAESPSTDLAVAQTAGQVLTWSGRVATTYYSASSGGETADIRDLWPQMGEVPYLRPVPDPYDAASPHHVWGPVVLTPAALASRLGVSGLVASVRLERSPTGRVAAVDVELASGGSERLSGKRVEEALKLRSNWFSVGELTLEAASGRVLYGDAVRLAARASGTGATLLQRRVGAGPWRTLRRIDAGTSVTVRPEGTTEFRLSAPGIAGPQLAVAVAPRVWARPLTLGLLGGRVVPRPSGAVTVWRYEPGGWRIVARPLLDAQGVFQAPVRLRAGGYRIEVAADGRLAETQTGLVVTKRLLASLGGG